MAPSVAETTWERIVQLYGALCQLAPGPVVELNRTVAVSMAQGPEAGMQLVEDLVRQGALAGSHLLPGVRGELLARLGRGKEAATEFRVARDLAGNTRLAAAFEAKAVAARNEVQQE